MLLFGIFVLILMCVAMPELMFICGLPFILMGLYLLGYVIKLKIKTGYYFPWEHREELKKKGVTEW